MNPDEKKEIASILIPEVKSSPEDYLVQYKKRDISPEALVTRFAPSPTGFLHIGGVFAALVSERLAHQSEGVFFLRIEDTDKKREVEGSVGRLISSLESFGVTINEGVGIGGDYGPYVQSERKDIYLSFVKQLLEQGLAYPCFCNTETLTEMREEQEAQKIRPGYYGSWTKCRDLSLNEIEKKINNGEEYVIRFRSSSDESEKENFKDILRGGISVTQNDIDIVLLKTNKMPTYHLAHVVDDYLMGTTHVIRGDEWISSLSVHLQLFAAFGWETPAYGHLAPILKSENGNKRKLSKRKDPEASMDYYAEKGYPNTAIIEYLLNIANSSFEDWRRENPERHYSEFTLKLDKFSKSGALFSIDKLDNISKLIISKMQAEDVYIETFRWAEEHDQDLAEILKENKEYCISIFTIERDVPKPRKDIANWSEVSEEIFYFFDAQFAERKETVSLEYPENIRTSDIKELLLAYKDHFVEFPTKEEWFTDLKVFAEEQGFSGDMKEYKKDPEAFKGSVADVATILRIATTTLRQTPDLHAIMNVLGKETVIERLEEAAK